MGTTGCFVAAIIENMLVNEELEDSKASTKGLSEERSEILLVEDNAETREMLPLLLEGRGFKVSTASTGLEAVERILGYDHGFNGVVLLDIGLPELDGHGVIRELARRSIYPVTIVCLSGYGRKEDISKAHSRATGMVEVTDYLVKPCEPDSLPGVLRHALRIQDIKSRYLRSVNSRGRTRPMTESKSLLRTLILAGILAGILFGASGSLLIYNGAVAESEVSFLGQQLQTSSVGIVAVFFGAAIIALTLVNGFSHARPQVHTQAERLREIDAEPPMVAQPTEKMLQGLVFKTTDAFEDDLREQQSTRSEIVGLVCQEFESHRNYLLYDLEDYPLPLRGNKIVVMNKLDNIVELYRLVPATADLAKRGKWEGLLALYRRISRLPYRTNPTHVLQRPENLELALELHAELGRRLKEYLDIFECGYGSTGVRVGANDEKEGRLAAAVAAQEEARDAANESLYETVISAKVQADVVSALERSLQYYHKLLLDCAPVSKPQAAAD